ncbi:hypothetical protein HK097_007653 [Rhizophlyctis rosea]|uniref:Alpha-soluble NSF attachment protein n=1 Tax=Rhizophlyctis rosea TaxID=64517 RepID=A0AAD5SBE0_9FUNG|nr:hypothetical protein HK097_007653 [Rhizophlyctis rosea]
MSQSEREGRLALQEADKKAQYKGWFGSNKLEEATDLYAKAANAFKLAKLWKEAGDAFVKQADVLNKMNERDEACTAYLNASKAYKKASPHDAVRCLQQAVEILVDRGRFSAAAQNQKQLAEIYENEIADFAQAMRAFELAAEWYHGEDSNAGIDVSDDLKDFVRARQAIERYQHMDVTFADTRECKFLKELLDAVDAGDAQAFTDSVANWDRLSKLDSWKTTLLLKIKKSISEEVDFT